jgi:hypothetical protein
MNCTDGSNSNSSTGSAVAAVATAAVIYTDDVKFAIVVGLVLLSVLVCMGACLCCHKAFLCYEHRQHANYTRWTNEYFQLPQCMEQHVQIAPTAVVAGEGSSSSASEDDDLESKLADIDLDEMDHIVSASSADSDEASLIEKSRGACIAIGPGPSHATVGTIEATSCRESTPPQ